jgi:hypothetical protein
MLSSWAPASWIFKKPTEVQILLEEECLKARHESRSREYLQNAYNDILGVLYQRLNSEEGIKAQRPSSVPFMPHDLFEYHLAYILDSSNS